MVERFTFDIEDGYVLASDYDALAARLAEATESYRESAAALQRQLACKQVRLAEVEAERDKILRLWLEDADPDECGYAIVAHLSRKEGEP